MGNAACIDVRKMPTSPVPMPIRLAERIEIFLCQEKTGNITLHIRQGKILGWSVEEKEQA